jgi:hypothetical protein
MSTCSGLAIFRAAAGRTRCELRRLEELALRYADRAMHRAGTDLFAAAQKASDLLQKRIAALDRDRPGGSEDGVELGIGQANGRHLADDTTAGLGWRRLSCI